MFKDKILTINNFSISYESPHYYSRTLRDKFVELIKNPLDLLFNSKDRFFVLDQISFDVFKGDIIGLLGTNGVGKTSLCRYLSGIIKSNEIKGAEDTRAIFDTNISFYPNLTGHENTVILAELLYSKYGREEKKAIIKEALDFSDLKEFIHMPINRYSRGMKARLYLSLVTAREAELIILDEIFGGTDMFFAERLSSRIKQLIEKSGSAIIVSHNLEDIKLYCNRTIVLSNKKILFDGALEKGLEIYKTQH
jgi:ABC-type polysaccharide/polyol phosphate transport system ATPase subunit